MTIKIETILDHILNNANATNPNDYFMIKQGRVRTLFDRFLSHHTPFSECINLNTHNRPNLASFDCPSTDGSSPSLKIVAKPESFVLGTSSKGYHYIDGPLLSCDSNRNGSGYDCFFGASSTDQPYQLTDRYPECTERYQTLAMKEAVESNCEGLPLFDQILNQSTAYEEISSSDRAWSFTKMGVGISGTFFCGYKTWQAIQKFWDASKPKLQENQKKPDPKKAEEAKKQAIIWGVASVASAIFTAFTYYKDFSTVYFTVSGQPVRFTS